MSKRNIAKEVKEGLEQVLASVQRESNKMKFNYNVHTPGNKYELTYENMNAMVKYIEYLVEINNMLENDMACARLELDHYRDLLDKAGK